MPNKFTRGAPDPSLPRRGRVPIDKRVTLGGVALPPQQAAFLIEYVKRFNGAESARAVCHTDSGKYPGVYAADTLAQPSVRLALRGMLEERRNKAEHKVEDVARYYWSVATADPRELTQHIRVCCRHCHGVDHDYQYTDVEQRDRERDYHMRTAKHQRAVAELRKQHPEMPESQLPEAPLFFEGGGGGFNANLDPMRGPDWVAKMEREFTRIGRPLPEWVESNADHSCPACHGDGVTQVYVADTRYLSAEAALLYDGVKISRDKLEIKQLDRVAAMSKFEALMGMSGPHRVELSGPGGGPLDVRVTRIESRVIDADFTDITEEVVAGTLPNGKDHSEENKLPVVKTVILDP